MRQYANIPQQYHLILTSCKFQLYLEHVRSQRFRYLPHFNYLGSPSSNGRVFPVNSFYVNKSKCAANDKELKKFHSRLLGDAQPINSAAS